VSIKDELHDLVNRLDDRQTAEALAYLRLLLNEEQTGADTARARLARRMGPGVVSGRAFLAQQPRDLPTIAAEQGVQPVTSLDDLVGDFWPDDESVDEFIATVREWRREGGHA
jgi:hypothetical protein